nr:DUF4884 domain-containing protein [Saprospiraceae bacterium]
MIYNILCELEQSNSGYYLFEHEGFKVYRFRDSCNFVYFTNCIGDTTSVVNDSTRVNSINNREILKKPEN